MWEKRYRTGLTNYVNANHSPAQARTTLQHRPKERCLRFLLFISCFYVVKRTTTTITISTVVVVVVVVLAATSVVVVV